MYFIFFVKKLRSLFSRRNLDDMIIFKYSWTLIIMLHFYLFVC
ncbi:unnamed protein product [Spodoptera exigua]|nr:unnamed protein product [Spodoptera exigua]